MNKNKEEKDEKKGEKEEDKFGELIDGILKRFKKKNAKVIKQADKDNLENKKKFDPALSELIAKIEEWKVISRKINDVTHFIGAKLEENGYPCSASISPIFHPDTHQTYSNQALFQVALVQLDDLSTFMKKNRHGLFNHRPCRDEVCSKALEVASCIRFIEDLTHRRVKIEEKIFSKEVISYTLSFDKINKKKIKEIMENFILKAFNLS
ncbi:MAG: hypothetical protein H7832_08155 [Magnetococcus sp. DMHC-6]